MEPLDFIALLWYYLHIAHGFIGNILMSILAIGFIVLVTMVFFKIVWSVVKFICKPLVLLVAVIATIFLVV